MIYKKNFSICNMSDLELELIVFFNIMFLFFFISIEGFINWFGDYTEWSFLVRYRDF